MFEPDRLPAPDAEGFFVHPDMPDIGESDLRAAILELGFEYDAPQSEVDSYFTSGVREECAAIIAGWTPDLKQADPTWTLIAKYDAEDGPFALLVRPVANTPGAQEHVCHQMARIISSNPTEGLVC